MTNYDRLKEYEAHKKPLPHYDVWKNIHEQWKVAIPQLARLQEQKQKVIALIKDGRFVEALQELEGK